MHKTECDATEVLDAFAQRIPMTEVERGKVWAQRGRYCSCGTIQPETMEQLKERSKVCFRLIVKAREGDVDSETKARKIRHDRPWEVAVQLAKSIGKDLNDMTGGPDFSSQENAQIIRVDFKNRKRAD